jgi:hypothetical protein
VFAQCVLVGCLLLPQLSAREPVGTVWTGTELIVWGDRDRSRDVATALRPTRYELRAALFEPASDSWTRLPRVPIRLQECYPESFRAGRVIIAWYCGRGALFEIATGAWRRLAALPVR